MKTPTDSAAERKQSLGYDWHPECLRCEECGKRLNPGQHAEVTRKQSCFYDVIIEKLVNCKLHDLSCCRVQSA